jgi:2-polyprenyl-6-hydroxyphenyl methylase/3-demethylubiquinone-9 3-methyltransferase
MTKEKDDNAPKNIEQSFYEKEVAKFDNLSADWWLSSKSFDLLHQINPLRINYIRKTILHHKKLLDLSKLKILDVGCGGGLASIPLAKVGANITGIDAGINNIKTAKDYALELELENAKFICSSIENYQSNSETYDVIICLEMTEQVEDQENLLVKIKS